MGNLGNFIKAKREAEGLSLRALGNLAGISDTELMKIESGERQAPGWQSLVSIAQALHFNPVALLVMAGYISEDDVRGAITEMEKKKADENPPETVFRMGELFCGPGGLAVGALRAHIDGPPEYRIIHKWANDYDSSTCDTYAYNICPNDPLSVYCEDVHELDIEKLGDIDAFVFGFPCNDFSQVGEQKGFDGEYGPLYTYGIKVLKRYRPKWFLAENVGGIKSANQGKAFEQIKKDMIAAGYRIYPNLYEFERYGVPQARHRVIIVGIRDDLPFEFNIPSYEQYKMRTCRQAIEEPPIPKDAPNNERTKQSKQVVERLSYIKPGQNAFTADLPEELRIKTATQISQIYKRLDPEKPAYTVTGSGGGGTHIYHWEELRALTNRERARLQTFPDDFIFRGSKESVRKQIGMAVPCDGAEVIFTAILKTFAGVPYESVEPNMNVE